MSSQPDNLIRVVWDKRLPIVLAGLVAAVTAFAVSFLFTKSYRTETSFFVVTDDATSGLAGLAKQIPIAALAGFLGNPRGQSREEALAYLRSRQFSESFIQNNQLLPLLFPGRWDRYQEEWKDPEDVPTLWEAFKVFNEDVRGIREDRVTGMVTVSIDWQDPREAQLLANLLVQQADNGLRKIAIEEADRNLGYLRDELTKESVVEMRQALYGMIEKQLQHSMVARVADQYVFKVIDPAKAPDSDDFIFPNRLAIAILAFLFTMALASIFFIARYFSRESETADPEGTG